MTTPQREPTTRRPPTLDEFRATTEAEISAAVRDAFERYFTGEPPPKKKTGTTRATTERTGFLPGLSRPRGRP